MPTEKKIVQVTECWDRNYRPCCNVTSSNFHAQFYLILLPLKFKAQVRNKPASLYVTRISYILTPNNTGLRRRAIEVSSAEVEKQNSGRTEKKKKSCLQQDVLLSNFERLEFQKTLINSN